ncbi:urotensin-2 receptor-like [Brienomyrus brachyistius]|uniref:urotensin-2 receptor-like n=1 Tax=Brienomyrus brachyistius TaxID=42636 RepID=UPI0020B34C27|nr:urotensin-2 receptor-like [Brienomyrus brachyistius]
MGAVEGIGALPWSPHNATWSISSNSSPPMPYGEPHDSFDEMLVTSLLGTVLIVMCVIGLAGNIYTLVVMNVSLRMTGSMYVYIVNLALADLLYLSTIPFVVCTYFAKDWYFGDIGCRIIFSLDFLTMHASIFILTIMSTERYLAVVNPLDTLGRSRRYRRTVTCAVWLASFLLALPTMIMIDLKSNLRNGVLKRMCHPTWQIKAYKIYLTVLFNTCILAPGFIIGYLYLRLAKTYWLSQSTVHATKAANRCPKQKVFYMIFSIVLAYWACFLPFWLWQLLSIYYFGHGDLSHRTMVYVNFVVTCLAYCNSCINPFLYTLLTKNYKEYVRGRQKSFSGFGWKFRHASQRSVSSGSQFTDTLTIAQLSGGPDGSAV